MHSSTSSFDFERAIPDLPWRHLALTVLVLVAAAVGGWESFVRQHGYTPTLNDTSDLWADRRSAVKPDSVVIIGDSRALFGLDLNLLEQGLGKRPVQLALVGSSAFPILKDLTSDKSFHGTILLGNLPIMYLVPAGPPLLNSEKALKRYHNWTVAQKASHWLGMLLEEHVAFLQQEDLTLEQLLMRLPIPNRPYALIPPKLPPYFYTLDRERRALMTEEAARPGPLQSRIQQGWLPLFTPPPPPRWIPIDAFLKHVGETIESRFKETAEAVETFRARGGKVVFLRMPMSGPLKTIEDKASPRSMQWTRLLKDTKSKGIYFEDFDELSHFECPEWSHLSATDSVEFTRRLMPHLKAALDL